MPAGGIPRGSGRRGRAKLTGRRPGPARADCPRARGGARGGGRGAGPRDPLGAGPGVTSPARLGQSAARVGLLKALGNLSESWRTKKQGGGAGRKVAGSHALMPRLLLPPRPPFRAVGDAEGSRGQVVPLASVTLERRWTSGAVPTPPHAPGSRAAGGAGAPRGGWRWGSFPLPGPAGLAEPGTVS